MTATIRWAGFGAPRTASTFRGALVALLLAASWPAEGSTLWERKDGPFFSRVVVWDAAQFNEPSLRLLYRQLSQERMGNRAWTVRVFVDEGDATRELHGKLATEKGYDWWLDLYNKFGRNLLPMAEIAAYENNAVLRLRDGFGACSETVLSGDNFLRLRVGNIAFEILEAYYHPLPPHTDPSPGDEAMVSIYVRASSFPSVNQAREFSLLMQKRLRQKRIMVLFRTDAAFLTDGAFPIMYRFDSSATPPAREQYKQSKTMSCFCDLPGVLCRWMFPGN